jgi:hypothetical protein
MGSGSAASYVCPAYLYTLALDLLYDEVIF